LGDLGEEERKWAFFMVVIFRMVAAMNGIAFRVFFIYGNWREGFFWWCLRIGAAREKKFFEL
jgi:hypothetical protein